MITKQSKIYIAGHKGMVGSSIWSALKNKGYYNLIGRTSIELDLRSQKDVNKFFNLERPEVVINAAAKVGGILANKSFPYQFLMENMLIQNNLINGAFISGIEKFIFLGSSCIYPKFAPQPLKEESLLTSSLEPTLEPYALAKISGLKLCDSLRRQYGFDAICLMPSNLYGPGDNFNENNSHVLPSLIRKFHFAKEEKLPYVTCWGSGNVLREFLYVDDLSKAILVTLKEWDPDFSAASKLKDNSILTYLNVGVGKDISIKDLANMIAKVIGYQGEIKWDITKKDGTPRKLLDISRIEKLGWSQETKLKDGLKITYDYFLKSLSDGSTRL